MIKYRYMIDLDDAVFCCFDTNAVMQTLNENYDCNITKHILNNFFQNKIKNPQSILQRVQRSRV